MESATSIPSLWKTTLESPPSCIAFCPTHPDLVVIGTYLLHSAGENASEQNGDEDGNETRGEQDDEEPSAKHVKAEQRRSGSLILFRVEEGGEEITHIQTLALPTAAVLDIQWSPHPRPPLLAVATSTGHIAFYRLHGRNPTTPELRLFSTHAIAEPSTLVLSLAWHPQDARTIGVTLSTGAVVLCHRDVHPDYLPWHADSAIDCEELHSHDLEAWTLAFLTTSPDETVRVLSGGDDCVLRLVDGWSDRKTHSAGVTAILPLGGYGGGDMVVTGSYDDRVRLIRCPTVGRREVLAELDLGGGVWRLSELRRSGSLNSPDGEPGSDRYGSLTLLASCMHAGVRVLRLHRKWDDADSETWEFEVLARFEEHGSMNYGSAAQPSTRSLRTIVSTSFYDKKMCLWRVDVGGSA